MEQEFEYRTLAKEAEGKYSKSGSKFLAILCPVDSRSEALERISEMKSAHPKASHLCYAWRLGLQGEEVRSSDDGEPSGSAGLPILNQLISQNLVYIVAIVTRYYGGSKLGLPGLVKAYKSAVQDALKSAMFITKRPEACYRIRCGMEHASILMNAWHHSDFKVEQVQYTDGAEFIIKVPHPETSIQIKKAMKTAFSFTSLAELDKEIDRLAEIKLIDLGI